MDSTADALINIDDLDEWLASGPTDWQPAASLDEAALQSWLQESFQDQDNARDATSSQLPSASAETEHAGRDSKLTPSSEDLERIRQKNRLAQQRSRKRRNDQVKELEDQVRQLYKLLTLERQRNRSHSQSTPADSASQDVHQRLLTDQDSRRTTPDPDFAADTKQMQGSPVMSALLSSLSDGSYDESFFPLLGRHFGTSAASHRTKRASPVTAFEDPEAAVSWLISFTADSNNFARATRATQVSIPSVIVMPELVLYKVCRFYFKLLLPFSTMYGSGMVNLNAAKVMQEPTSAFDHSGPQISRTMDPEGYLPELLMPTRMQRMVGAHPIEVAVIPFASLRERLLLTLMTINGKSGFDTGSQNDTVSPDQRKIHDFTFSEKPNSRGAASASINKSRPGPKVTARQDPLRPVARRWIDSFMVDFVASLRVWNASDDCFNTTAFELRPEFVAKYRVMLDDDIVRTSNFWRRSRGEPRSPS